MTPKPALLISQVDPADPVEVDGFTRLYHAADTYGRPYAVPYRLEELRAQFADQHGSERLTGYLGRDTAGAAVAAGMLNEPLTDNRNKANAVVWVQPDSRRRGFGSALAQHLIAVATARGRLQLMSAVNQPLASPDTAALRFAARHGFRPANTEIHRILDIPADKGVLTRLVEESAPHHRNYRFIDIVGAEMPDEVLPSYVELVNALLTDAPTGDVEFEPGGLDPPQWRANEQTIAAMGRTDYRCVAIGPEGRAVAHSVLVVSRHDPGRVFQWDTLVRREHRGHRLGIAVKARNLLALQRAHPGPAVIHTWNADSNRWMIAVNEQLGFRAVELSTELLRRAPN